MKYKASLHIIVIVLLGLLAYSNTFDVPFHFDDQSNIVENPLIKDLSNVTRVLKGEGIETYDPFKDGLKAQAR